MSVTSQRIRFCTSRDGTRLALATCGAGPPLVRAAHWLSHLDHEVRCPLWGPWLSLLARRHTVIRYDGRGCGLSDRDVADLSVERSVEDLEAAIEASGLDRFVLFGATIGGMTAVAYAARHPERVSHLVVVGALSVGRMVRSPTVELIEKTQLELKAIELGWANDNPAFRQFFTSLLIPDSTPAQARSLNELMLLACSPQSAIGRLQPFHHIDLREVATKVRCPTLVFHSRSDARIPFEQGRALAALIPDARFVPLESRNHWVVDTEPAWQRFVGELEQFLPRPVRAQSAAFADLTSRERQVLELVAAGLGNSAIGTRLGISEKTVRNHVSMVLDKLGVGSRSQAIVCARDAGFGRETSP